MDAIQPFLDYFSHNPGWALVVVFLIAFGEALLIIGLFVPSTAVLLGAGALVGLGKLGFTETLAATAIGAILGDQVSFWAGRLYGERLKTFWPLRNYPALLARGEDFVRSHGGKSIAIGRFVPGVKAVVPGIVGMLGMGQAYFAAVNFSSGLVWALAHIIPGILIGQGLALASELSGRLAIVLVGLIVMVSLAGWLIRLAIGWAWPVVENQQRKLYGWSLTRPEKRWRRLGRIFAPHNPRAVPVMIFILLGLLALGLAWRVLTAVFAQGPLENIDLSVFRLAQSLRNAPADELMIVLTMAGDTLPVFALVAAMAGWLLWRRAYRAAIALAATAALAQLLVTGMKHWVGRIRPLDIAGGAESLSFPSGHATMTMTVFGLFAVIASSELGRWSRALVLAAAAALALLIGVSRIYLGAHWLSDVTAGLLFGALFAAAFGIFYETMPRRRGRAAAFAVIAGAIWLSVASFNIGANYTAAEARYVPRSAVVTVDVDAWRDSQWAMAPARRIDMAGKQDEAFIAQWAGAPEPIATAFAADGWRDAGRWTWRQGLAYLNPAAALDDLPPRPALHQGLGAALTFVKPDADGRQVLRVWRTDIRIAGTAGEGGLLLVSLTRDRLRPRFSLYALPSPVDARPEEIAAAVALLKSAATALDSASPAPLLLER